MYRLLLLFGLMSALYACTNQKSNSKTKGEPAKGSPLVFVENLTFLSGFNSGNVQIEEFDSSEYICYSDFYTAKEIAIHSLNTEEVHHISFENILTLGHKIQAVEVLNLDTVMVLTQYTNKLFYINRNGIIWKEIDFTPSLQKYGDFELWRGNTPFMFNDTCAIFPMVRKPDTGNQANDVESYREYYKKVYSAPTLYKVKNIFADSIEVEVGLFGLYNRFTDLDHMAIEGRNFTYLNKKILFFTNYSDTLYCIDPKTLTIERKAIINSDYGSPYMSPVTIKEHMLNGNAINENFATNMSIYDILYNEKNQNYWVTVRHKMGTENESVNRPWSIILLDSSFQKIDEFKMNHAKYYNQFYFWTGGLLISNYYETLHSKNHFKENTLSSFRHE